MILKSYISNVYLGAFLLVISAGCFAQTPDDRNLTGLYEDLPFVMEKVTLPDIPEYTVSITDFGAKGDGYTSNTKAINSAIDAVSEKGGGTVIIPEGIWVTGPIRLKSNIRLHTADGAIILASKDFGDYPLVQTWYEGLSSWRAMAPLFAENAENIAITGGGIFDGSGESWRPVKKYLMTEDEWKKTVNSGGVITPDGKTWYPDSAAMKEGMHGKPHGVTDEKKANEIKSFLRPVMLNFIHCKKILLDGITLRNTPSWCLHPLLCDQITISNVKVLNEESVVNGDALDLESCKNAIIYNCIFDAGDDAICMKSGRDEEGRRRAIPTENVIIANCTVYHGHGGFVVGSEMSGGVRNIKVSHCSFLGTDNGLRFKSTRGRGGLVENIYISDIHMLNIRNDAILFDLYYFVKEKSSIVPPADQTTPQFRNIHLKNISCKGADRAILLQGLPEMNLSHIRLENITIESQKGVFISDVNSIQIRNLSLNSVSDPCISVENAINLELTNLQIPKVATVILDGSKTSRVIITGQGIKKENVRVMPVVNEKNIEIKPLP